MSVPMTHRRSFLKATSRAGAFAALGDLGFFFRLRSRG